MDYTVARHRHAHHAIHTDVVPIASDIRNAYIDFSTMTVSVVALVTDVIRDGAPVVGYGFHSNGRYAQSGLLAERFVPRVLEAAPASLLNDAGDNLDPHRVWAAMFANEKPGGHGERSVLIGTLDMAVWDAVAKIERKPLYRLLAERYREGTVDDQVFVYAAGGYYYPGKDLTALQDEMRLFSMQDARNLIRYGGMRSDRDWLQFACALSYGLAEYLRIVDMLGEHGWSARRCIPHGGHQMSLNIAAGLGLGGNESYPGVFAPFGGFADDTPVVDGHVHLSDAPGIGIEAKSRLLAVMRGLH